MNSDDAAGGIEATIETWRRRGDHRFDPVRFRFIEALARRAADHGGAARRLLDGRLQGHLAAYADALRESREAADPATAPLPPTAPGRGALAELAAQLGPQAAAAVPPGGGPATPAPAPAGELKTLRYFKSTWSRLSAERRLTQSLAKVPENAGPLNSHHLVHRALTLMRDLSPEYLNQFMSYVDGLLWLDAMNARGPAAAANAAAADTGRKGARGRSR